MGIKKLVSQKNFGLIDLIPKFVLSKEKTGRVNVVKPNQVKVRLWLGWDFDNNNNNKTTLKQLGCDLIIISLV